MNQKTDRHGTLSHAVAFAAYAHDGQTRKCSNLPYILHPMETASIAATMTEDEDVLCAALLHDVIEDCGVPKDALRARFGVHITLLLLSVTEEKDPDAAGSWQRRKLKTINRLRAASEEEMILTLSDKLSNLRSIRHDLDALGPSLWQRFNQNNPTLQKWFYASIAEGLKPLEDTHAYREYIILLGEVF